jgi:hypothetical protein
LGESDIDLDQNEVHKRCLHLMPDCDTAIGSETPARRRAFASALDLNAGLP